MSSLDLNGISFGKWLRQQRRALDLTQQAFADQVGCARITLRRIESGALKPSKELALLILEKAGVPSDEREAWIPFTRGQSPLPAKPTNPLPQNFRTNLPASLSTFIGREKEKNQVISLLVNHRLVTLTGSGGVGKTRLSLQVASELLPEYPIGIWVVELAALTDPLLVPQAVCAAIGVNPDANTSALEALINYLRSKRILLVLDNCEHLIDACSQLCAMLLRTCPELWILASSRELLGISGEHAYRVPSLSLPNSKSILHIIQESEAVGLFVERAAASLSGFELTESNAPFIAQICQRLDGIALAIELAASRVKMFKVEQIAARLDNAFSLLTGGDRTSLPRQQTLRALISWSYNLLSEEEKSLVRQLSVFMGGWTLDAAEAVCSNANMVETLTHLVDKSLVSVDHGKNITIRYYLLETIRQYAYEKLLEAEGTSQLRHAHLGHYLKTAEELAPDLHTRKMPYCIEGLEIDYANYQLALEWAQEHDFESGLRLSNALYALWYIRGEYRNEGLEWFEKFLNTENSKRDLNRSLGLLNLYNLSTHAPGSKTDNVVKYLEESLLVARELGEHKCLAMVLGSYGSYELFAGNYESAQVYYEQSLSEAHLAGDERLIGIGLYRRGQYSWYQKDYDTARSLFEDSLNFLSKAGDLEWWALCLNFLGSMSSERGDWDAAHEYYEEALSLAEEAHDRSYTSVYLLNLGFCALGIGDFELGESFLSQGRELIQDTPDDHYLYDILKGMGEIARFQGDFDKAEIYYTRSLAYPQWETDKANTYCLLADLERMQGQLPKAKDHLLSGLRLLKTKADWIYSADDVIPYIAYYAISLQMVERASTFLGWIENWNKVNGHIQPPVYQDEFKHFLKHARDHLTEKEFKAAYILGKNMGQEQVLVLAMDILQQHG